jgi:hypothetical protein
MALATLTQCETRWRPVLASSDERCEKLISDHPDAMEELDLVRASIVQIRQRAENLPKANGNGTMWKQLADRAEADRHNLCKFLDGQALLVVLFHMYAATYKDTRDSLQLSSKEYHMKMFRKQKKTRQKFRR